MKLIQGITDSAYQESTVTLDDGTTFTIDIRFVPMQYGWFIDRLVYEDFTYYNLRICNSTNILHQFRNKIPFGLACVSVDDREPSLQEDFLNGSSKLYLLSEDETLEYARVLSGQV